jgi:hypothetical protein
LERGERGIRREPYQLRQLEEGRGWCQAYLLLACHLATGSFLDR